MQNVHHIHVCSTDDLSNYATIHIVTNADSHKIKHLIREKLKEHSIAHVTLELEAESEHCHQEFCHVEIASLSKH